MSILICVHSEFYYLDMSKVARWSCIYTWTLDDQSLKIWLHWKYFSRLNGFSERWLLASPLFIKEFVYIYIHTAKIKCIFINTVHFFILQKSIKKISCWWTTQCSLRACLKVLMSVWLCILQMLLNVFTVSQTIHVYIHIYYMNQAQFVNNWYWK